MNDALFWGVLTYAIAVTVALGLALKGARPQQARDIRGRFVKRAD